MKPIRLRTLAFVAVCSTMMLNAPSVRADPFAFSTGDPDGKIATASRPGTASKIEVESADDFILSSATKLTKASFTGLLVGGATLADIGSVVVEIYRVFPKDSINAPSGNVPTRVNSPSDVAFGSRSSEASELSFATVVLNASFSAANSVVNGINKLPNQYTGGEGAVTGIEVRFDIDLRSDFLLPADHYFFIPQVDVARGEFLWLSAPRPIVAPGTPFTPDLQSWIRNENLAPDWLRVGTDITHQGPFNAAFSLKGETVAAVPEPHTWALLVAGLGVVGGVARRRAGPGTPA